MRDEPEAVVPYAKGGIVNGPIPEPYEDPYDERESQP